jgi:hypothetical protein
MKKVTKKSSKPEGQLAKFKAAAKELGCEENEARYEALLGNVAKQKPTPRKPAKNQQ